MTQHHDQQHHDLHNHQNKTSWHVHGAPPQKPLRVWKCFRSRQFFEKRWSRGNFQNFHFNFSAPVSNRLDHYDAVVIHLLLIRPAHWLCLHDQILPLKKLWKNKILNRKKPELRFHTAIISIIILQKKISERFEQILRTVSFFERTREAENTKFMIFMYKGCVIRGKIVPKIVISDSLWLFTNLWIW